ncbi:MAG: hypothetical protein U5R06_16480 [candidate division KSB1 bacterium]|nr:hypothetical protein [candidate division KSB1 bacterium]
MAQSDHFNWLYKRPVLLGFIIIALVIVTLAGVKYLASRHYRDTIKNLEQRLTFVRSKLESESLRQYEIDKVISIIELYNRDLDQTRKYEIADEIYNMTRQYPNLNTALLTAVITTQTRGTWQPGYMTENGRMGLFALLPVTGMLIASHTQVIWSSPDVVLTDAIYNIRIGSHYLSSLITTYDIDGGLVALMESEKTAARWKHSGKKNSYLPTEIRSHLEQLYNLYQEQK